MEVEGMVRGLECLKSELHLTDRNVEQVTEAHPQIISKLAAPCYSSWVTHQMDIWHKAHKIGSKVLEVSKRKECEPLREWVPAIKNHFWHSAESCGGDLERLQSKWQSLLYYVQGVHEWYGGQCSHGPISDDYRTPLHPESPAVDVLRSIVKDKTLNKSLRFYTHFRYKAMEGRIRMAIFDHNHHVHRKPQHKQDGSLQYRRQFSNKGRRWVAVMIKEPKDYVYRKPLISIILLQRRLNPG